MIVCCLFLLFPIVRLAIYPHHMYLFTNDIVWLDFMIAPLASLGVMLLAVRIEECPQSLKDAMIWLGNNTMMIMAIHLPVMYIMSDLRPFVNLYVLFKVIEEIAMWAISIGFACIANKYCPWIVGKKKIKS